MRKLITVCILAFLATGSIHAQEKTTMNVKDLDSDIEKYVKKSYPEYKIAEAFKYDLVYGVKIQKGDSVTGLIFDRNAKFKAVITEAEKAKYNAMQTRSTMTVADVSADVTKYIKKNYAGYSLTEAYNFDEVYLVKIVKAEASEMLLFDKEGNFIRKPISATPAPKPAAPVTQDVPQNQIEPAVADTSKN